MVDQVMPEAAGSATRPATVAPSSSGGALCLLRPRPPVAGELLQLRRTGASSRSWGQRLKMELGLSDAQLGFLMGTALRCSTGIIAFPWDASPTP